MHEVALDRLRPGNRRGYQADQERQVLELGIKSKKKLYIRGVRELNARSNDAR